MRPLIDDIRLLDRKTATNNEQEVLPENFNVSQENEQETPEQLLEVDFQRVSDTGTLASVRVKNFIYLEDDCFLKDKQKQNRVKIFIETDDVMIPLNEESKEGQRQRRITKDYIEV